MLSEVFWVAFISTASTTLLISIKYCLKSKCEHFSICGGLLKIDRRVDLETQIDLQQIESGENKNNNQSGDSQKETE